MSLELRWARPPDVKAYYGDKPVPSIRAIVGIENGEVVGIGGVRLPHSARETPMIFLDVKPGAAKRHRRALVTATRMILSSVQLAVAVCDPSEPGAPTFLKHFGFQSMGNIQEGELFKWAR